MRRPRRLNGTVLPSGPHDVIHFLSGKKVRGGYSITSSVCNWDGVSVTQVYGSFDLSNPDQIWDALAFTHETGHTLGTVHSHCYAPTLDQCFSGEKLHWPDGTTTSCYVGKVVASRGTIMSYCHMLAPGYYNNTAVEFGPTITAQIRKTLEPRQCLKIVSTCGDGKVEGDEECDDGNETPDDGCSATCQLEPCKVLPATPGDTITQTAWWGTRVSVTSVPLAGDKLTVRGTFELPAGSTLSAGKMSLPNGTALAPEKNGLRFVIESVARKKKLDKILPADPASLPPGQRAKWWHPFGSSLWVYRDQAGSVAGITTATVQVYPSLSGAPRIRVSIRGRNGTFGIAPWDVPLHLTVCSATTRPARPAAAATTSSRRAPASPTASTRAVAERPLPPRARPDRLPAGRAVVFGARPRSQSTRSCAR